MFNFLKASGPAKSILDQNIYSLSPHIKRLLFVLISLSIIILLIYGNTFDVPFLFDDRYSIEENMSLRIDGDLTLEKLVEVIEFMPARGVVMLTFAFNYYFGGLEPFGYHLVNITIHIFTSFFLFLFIFNTLNLPSLQEKYKDSAYSISMITAILWAINPVQVQAVTYIVQRMASMAAMFYILSHYFYTKGRVSQDSFLKKIYFILCITAGFAAFFSKQNTAMLPITILVYELLLIQKFSKKAITDNSRKILLIFSISLIIGIIYLLIDGFLFRMFEGYTNRYFTMGQRLLTQPRVLLFYVSLLLYPSPERLNIGHDIFVSQSLIDPPITIIAILALIISFIGALFLSKRYPLISFCILFFLLNHVIESSILPLELIFEHRNYLPSMMFFLPIAIGLIEAIHLFSYKRSRQFFLLIFVVGIIIGHAYATYTRNFAWQSKESLWLDAVQKAPFSSRNHGNMALYYYRVGELRKAMFHAEQAISYDRYTQKSYRYHGYSVMGDIYKKLNQIDRAIYYYTRAIELNPTPGVYNNRAMAFLSIGEVDKARKDLIQSLSKETTAEAHNNLGHILLKQGYIDAAISELHKAHEKAPTFPGISVNLGIAYKLQGKYEKAIHYYKQSIRLGSKSLQSQSDIHALMGLVEVYALQKDTDNLKFITNRLAEIFIKNDRKLEIALVQLKNPNSLYRSLMNGNLIAIEIRKVFYRKADEIENLGDKFTIIQKQDIEKLISRIQSLSISPK